MFPVNQRLFYLLLSAFVLLSYVSAGRWELEDYRAYQRAVEIYRSPDDRGRTSYRNQVPWFDDVPRLRQVLHELAKQGNRAIFVKSLETIDGKKVTYYSTLVHPSDDLGGRSGANALNLQPRRDGTIHHRLAIAFWKYKDGKTKLLALDRTPFPPEAYRVQHLREIIPLEHIREVV